jgi:predicted ATPase
MDLIEREPQLEKLSDAWRQAIAGNGRVALISGEAGIGKTSLVERFILKHRKSAKVYGALAMLSSAPSRSDHF